MGSDAEAAIVAFVIQAFVTGVQFTTFLLCLRWQIFSDDGWTTRKNLPWFMLIVTVLIFAFSLTTLGFGLLSISLALNGNDLLPTGITAVSNLPC